MHARGLVELAGVLASHGPLLLYASEPISAQQIEQYWTTSKVRLDRWAWYLRNITKCTDAGAQRRLQQWPATRSVLEEILVSEILTRVWTAVLCIYDKQKRGEEVEPIARSVLIGHMEARHRVLTLLVREPNADADAVLRLNHVRRRAERWTDLLIGRLARRYDVSEFAIDPQRAQDFAADLRQRSRLAGGRHAWRMIMTSLRAAFQLGLSPVSPNADLNARIAASILACFPAEAFDSLGLFRPQWLTRLTEAPADMQGMIAELLDDAPTAAHVPAAATPHSNSSRLRRFGP